MVNELNSDRVPYTYSFVQKLNLVNNWYTSRGVMVSKLESLTTVGDFGSHWVSHISSFVAN